MQRKMLQTKGGDTFMQEKNIKELKKPERTENANCSLYQDELSGGNACSFLMDAICSKRAAIDDRFG